MSTTKESFVFHKDWWNAICSLPEQIRGEVCENIIRYACGEPVAELSAMAAMAMRFITPQIDRDRAKYEARCEKNRINGTLGGRPHPNNAKPTDPETARTISQETETSRTVTQETETIRTQPNGSVENRMVTTQTECCRTGRDSDSDYASDSENENYCENKNESESVSVRENEQAKTSAHAHSQPLSPEEDLFNKFQAWLTMCAPTVLLFVEPLKCQEFVWLYQTYGAERLKQCAAEMHNKEAYRRNRKALTVFKSWIKRVTF